MKNGQGFYLAFVFIAIIGCVAPRLPAYVIAPEPPAEWKIFVEKEAGCPNATGEYELIPMVADLQNDGLWRFSYGNWYDYLLLIPFDRVIADKWTPNETSPKYSPTSLLFESIDQGNALRIISPDKNAENFATHIFSQTENDYACESGNLVFPEFKIQGGSEGAFLNGKIYRQATITSRGDLLFYEQVQSHMTVHKYFLFKMKNSWDVSN